MTRHFLEISLTKCGRGTRENEWCRRIFSGKTALVCVQDGSRYTYGDLDGRAGRTAEVWLGACRFAPGDRVGLLAHNRVEFIDAFFAAARSGVILVPLGTRLTPHEIEFIANDAGLRGFMYGGEIRRHDPRAERRDRRRAVDCARRARGARPRASRPSAVGVAAVGGPRRFRAPRSGGHLLPPLHERHHRQAQGRDGAAPHGRLERLQHGDVLWGGEPEPFLGDLLPRFLEDGHHVDHPPAWGDGPGDLRPPDEMAGTVREEVAALPRTFRIAVALCDIEGMETPEAARLLGLTEPALRTRLHRARQALRARLEGRLRRADT